jgi:AcrR family transcriptional regulator
MVTGTSLLTLLRVTGTCSSVTRKRTSVNKPDPPAPDGRRARWAHHREQRREELVDAAIAAIRRLGADVGMDALAAGAGISKPVLYRYFADRSQLRLAIGQRLTAELIEAVRPALAQVRGERAAVELAVDVYLQLIESEPELYKFVANRPGPRGEGDVVADTADTISGVLASVIGDRLRDLGLDAGPAEPWAHGLVGCLRAVGDWWLRHQMPMSRDALTAYLTTLLWGGVAGVTAAADLPGGLDGAGLRG